MLPIETLRLSHHGAQAWLAPSRGGLLTRFSVDGDGVLYLDEETLADETRNVRGGVPVLFPIAGRLAPDTLSGASAPLRQHGFARDLPWRVIEQPGAERVVLGLDASDLTRAAYPHEFALRFTYTLDARSLAIEQRFENLGDAPMPIQPGLHPYFRVDEKRGARVETAATIAWDGVRRERVKVVPQAIDLAAGDLDLHLLDHGEQHTRLVRPGARDVLLAWSADQRVLVLWTLPGRPFVCVEPWSAAANTLHDGGARSVPAHDAHTSLFTMTLADG
jgi:galactose mutarotase-like enzyme